MKIREKLSGAIDSLKLYWKHPPLGRYMPFKEIGSLAAGGIGAKFIISIVQLMMLSVGNGLIGNTIGIDPMPLYLIYAISVIIGIPLGALRAKMIDSHRNPKGKYRPYILTMGIPTSILAIAFVWMPYESMDLLGKCLVVLGFNIAFQFFFNFYNDAFVSLINVLSPNTIERSDVSSLTAVIDSLAPSIITMFMPLVAFAITGQNTLYDMRVYRYAYPPLIIIGFLISLLIYCNTKEKIIQAKTHNIQLKFSDAFRAVARNKYFWIISLAGWLGFLEGAFGNIMGWMYNYQGACSPAQYTLIITIGSNASLWPMLFAPLLIRAFGKRKLLVFSNVMNIFFIMIMLPVIRMGESSHMIWLLLGCTFMNNFVSTMGGVLNPSINADIRDYQQYISGERIDGMFIAVGLIGSIITLGTSLVLPAIYTDTGLNETTLAGLKDWLMTLQHADGSSVIGDRPLNVYDVLYDKGHFINISTVLIVASGVGALLNVIPFFFYDLTEIKQKAMVTVLRIRALFEDFGNNALSDEDLVGAIDMIEEASAFVTQTPVPLSKRSWRAAKRRKCNKMFLLLVAKLKRNKDAVEYAKSEYASVCEETKQEKAIYKNNKLTNEKIEISKYIMKEIKRFETSEGQADVERAQVFIDAGLDGISKITPLSLHSAKLLPKKTHEEKVSRVIAIEKARNEIFAQKTIAKYYPQGVEEFDSSVFDKLFAKEDSLDAKLNELYQSLHTAKELKRLTEIESIKEEISVAKSEMKIIKKQLKIATNKYAIFNRAARPYLDAKKLLIQQENYRHYEDIKANYEESKRRAEQKLAEQLEQEAREKEEKAAYAAKLKEERAAAKAAKKAENGKSEKAEKAPKEKKAKTDKSTSEKTKKVKSEKDKSQKVKSEKVKSEKTKTEKVKTDKVKKDKTLIESKPKSERVKKEKDLTKSPKIRKKDLTDKPEDDE